MSESFRNELQKAALDDVQSIPRDEGEPVFAEPWEAEVFAMAISLHEQGLFTWKEWASSLGQTIKSANNLDNSDTADNYYMHWLRTLEQLIVSKQIADQDHLDEMYTAWDRAAQSTPHGQAIELDNQP